MVALAAHVVVKLGNQAGRGSAHLQQDVGVGGTRTPRRLMLEEDVIGANAGNACQHGAVNRVYVIAAHRRELVLNTQPQGIVALGIGALGGDPLLVIVAGRQDAGHRFAQQVVIAWRQIPSGARELGLAHYASHRFAGRAHHRLQWLDPVDGAVDALGADPDIGRDGGGFARVGLDEVDHPAGLLCALANEIHIPRLEVEIGIDGGSSKGVWQHMARQEGADKPERRGDHHSAHQPPEGAHIAVVGDKGAGGLHLFFQLGLHGLLGGRHAGLGQQGHKIHVGAQVHRVTSRSPNS